MPAFGSRSAPERSSFSGLIALAGAPAPGLKSFIVFLLLLLYGYEIFDFSLSIDEEIYAYSPDTWLWWIAQGRWAMGLLTRVFPPVASIPVLSTVMFCTGVGVSAYVLARVLFRTPAAQWAFAGIFVSSPLWPHIAEFNTLSWGIGIGCVMLTLSLLLVLSGRFFDSIWAAGLLAMATGIYQVFYTWFLVLLCLRLLSILLGTAPVHGTETPRTFPWLRSGVIAVGGLLGYVAVGLLILAAVSMQPIYVEGFFRLGDFATARAQALARTLQRSWNLVGGADPIFLGYGHILTFLPLLGLLVTVGRLIGRTQLVPSQRALAGASLVAALGLALSPILMSAGTIPARALISWIPLTAFLGGVSLSNCGRFEKPLCGALAATLLVSIWVSVSLFYSDHLARQRDELLAARLMARIDDVLPDPRPTPVPFVVVGAVRTEEAGLFPKVEAFGNSFFEYDGGNPYRVAAYLRILGIDTLEPRGIADVAPHRAVIEAMPVWPAAGSVAIVSGFLVIKLGPMASARGISLDEGSLVSSRETASDPSFAREENIALRGNEGRPVERSVHDDGLA